MRSLKAWRCRRTLEAQNIKQRLRLKLLSFFKQKNLKFRVYWSRKIFKWNWKTLQWNRIYIQNRFEQKCLLWICTWGKETRIQYGYCTLLSLRILVFFSFEALMVLESGKWKGFFRQSTIIFLFFFINRHLALTFFYYFFLYTVFVCKFRPQESQSDVLGDCVGWSVWLLGHI